jgi:hypothetical protein
VGVDAIVTEWQRDWEPPDAWSARYQAAYVAGDIAIIKGETSYPAEGHRYANLFEVRLIDGKCASYVEWHMRMPARD